MSQTASRSTQRLEDAFEAFNQMSLQLEASYRDLEQRVARLSKELAAARSERLKQLAEKERLANRLERLLGALPGGVIVLDGDGTIQEANPAAREFLHEPLIGESWSRVYQREFANPDSRLQEMRLRDGRYVTLSARSLGTEPGQILLLQDVTETRALQEAVDRHQRLSAMGEMVAGLAHQIRTPLASAVLYASHLASPELAPEPRVRFAEKMRDRLRHMESMVNDMLTFARGGAVGMEAIPLAALGSGLAQALEAQLTALNAQLDTDNRAGEVVLYGNREHLLGALLNLATNALEACGSGARLRLVIQRSGDGVAIAVSDNGPGIPADVQGRIFEPFFTTRSQGTGLGLAVVRAVVESHHGRVDVDSRPGEGTTFTLFLPLGCPDGGLPSGVFGGASRESFEQAKKIKMLEVMP